MFGLRFDLKFPAATSRSFIRRFPLVRDQVHQSLVAPGLSRWTLIGGQVVKAFVVSDRSPDAAFATELQDLVRTRLSKHEYPRLIAFVDELPKTPAGKVNRKVLREREASAIA